MLSEQTKCPGLVCVSSNPPLVCLVSVAIQRTSTPRNVMGIEGLHSPINEITVTSVPCGNTEPSLQRTNKTDTRYDRTTRRTMSRYERPYIWRDPSHSIIPKRRHRYVKPQVTFVAKPCCWTSEYTYVRPPIPSYMWDHWRSQRQRVVETRKVKCKQL